MSKLSISEAHRATGKARSTIERHIADGTLSAEKNEAGRAYIDVSELQRVYGEVNPAAIKKAKQKPAALQDAATENDAELQLLRVKLEFTERERDEAQRREREASEERREAARQFQAERERLQNTIEMQATQIKQLAAPVELQQEPEPPGKRGFWAWLRGK
jgi:chromosome segregation ATPase